MSFWTYDFGAEGHRAYVTPMQGHGAPYRLTVLSADEREALISVGIPTVCRAVESALTFIEADGQRVPLRARQKWEAFARQIDMAGGWAFCPVAP